MELMRHLTNRLKVRHYALMLDIARLRSVSRVAKERGVAQPSVTRLLAEVEGVFQAPLFLRKRQGLEPTQAGSMVIAHARLVMADTDALERELQGLMSGRQGRIRIGHIPSVSNAALAATWEHLLDLRPRVEIFAHEDMTDRLVAALRDRTLDCALCRFSPKSTDDDLVQELLYNQRAYLVVATRSSAALQKRKRLNIAELSEMDWIFPPSNTPVRQLINTIFSAAGQLIPVPRMEASAVRAVSAAMDLMPRGVTVLAGEMAHLVAATGAAVMIKEPLPWNLPPVGMAWLYDSPKSKLIRAMVDAIKSKTEAGSW